MHEVMTMADIQAKFKSEWVLLEDPETAASLEVMSGKVLWHSTDRDEVYRKAQELAPQHSAIVYTGTLSDEVAVIFMTLPFDPRSGLIVVPTRLWGPARDVVVRLALDTGATGTAVNWDIMVLLGYDPATAPDRRQVTTGSHVMFVPRLHVQKIVALSQERQHFPVLCHTLPPSATVDGVLGLDFFRGQKLVVDFRLGIVTVE